MHFKKYFTCLIRYTKSCNILMLFCLTLWYYTYKSNNNFNHFIKPKCHSPFSLSRGTAILCVLQLLPEPEKGSQEESQRELGDHFTYFLSFKDHSPELFGFPSLKNSSFIFGVQIYSYLLKG